ncbi:Inner membrane ALBINO3-like protein 1, chloroplastic [Melia azedarach]|uniref:Inner membrane ALBINO3-like protein 1, chloroplastic n=1 Tax=Melia azedarach TaxID=155640 RepID=A0ACC1XHW9_MELAZ|nr:Inner membrane ALBINO3-like protein 1, chloroplastic [Melia azedarach]
MATSISVQPNLVLSPFPHRTATQYPLFRRTQFDHKPFLRGSLSVAKYGLRPDPGSSDGVIKELFGLLGRAESLLYTIADAAVSSSDTVTTTKQNSDWLSGITNVMETVLKVLKDGLSTLHVPYSYGFAVILLTILVKAATFPLTKKQVESAMAMRSLAPQVKAIQERYAGDKERIQLETARLYKLAGINPLAGCLPTLATIPVWIGLYRALSNVADEGLLSEGFFWIPSLAGPTTIAARQSGSGISWLFPFVDGHPPLGWSDTFAYLVLPVLLVLSQYISVQIMQSSQSNDPNMKSSQAVTKFLPLMIGYFSLSVPSGLSLYWFTNNILSTAQQVDIQKSVSGLNSSRKEARQGEELNAEGLRPGDRFKQIKEQEARRRQQREEEKRKAAEAVAKGNQTTNEVHEREINVYERANGAGASSLDKNNGILQSRTVKVSANSDINGRDEKQSRENLEKETVEVHMSSATSENKLSEDDAHESQEGVTNTRGRA